MTAAGSCPPARSSRWASRRAGSRSGKWVEHVQRGDGVEAPVQESDPIGLYDGGRVGSRQRSGSTQSHQRRARSRHWGAEHSVSAADIQHETNTQITQQGRRS